MPECKIIILTVSDDDNGYCLKTIDQTLPWVPSNLEPEQLLEMIVGVTKGEAPLSPTIATRILNELSQQLKREPQAGAVSNVLSGREKEVLRLVASGASNRIIAGELCITENTVKNHLRNILEKLHFQNRVQLAAYAVREGLNS